jgi:hypothetical protein
MSEVRRRTPHESLVNPTREQMGVGVAAMSEIDFMVELVSKKRALHLTELERDENFLTASK